MRQFPKAFLLLMSFAFFISQSMAQKSYQFEGGRGTAFLKDGTKVSGLISYDFKRDMLKVESDKRQFAYEASQVESFSFRQNDIPRYFESLRVQLNNGYVRHQLFELLYKGKASLYSRVQSVVPTSAPLSRSGFPGDISGYRMNPPQGRNITPEQRGIASRRSSGLYHINYDFYYTRPDFDFPIDLAERNFKRFKSAFGIYKPDISDFMKSEDIDIKDPLDVAKVIAYYNQMLQEM